MPGRLPTRMLFLCNAFPPGDVVDGLLASLVGPKEEELKKTLQKYLVRTFGEMQLLSKIEGEA